MWVRHGLHFKNIKNNKIFFVPLFIQSKKKNVIYQKRYTGKSLFTKNATLILFGKKKKQLFSMFGFVASNVVWSKTNN